MPNSAQCPHCGAEGRYIYWGVTESGALIGAMAGCLQLYPHSPFVKVYQRIADKERDHARKGWKLASWDIAVKDAIERAAKGEITVEQAWTAVTEANEAKAAWMRKRGYRR